MSTQEEPAPESEYGITEADRKRMGELYARRREHGRNRGSGGTGLPGANHPLVRDVRLEVVIRKEVDGRDYVSARELDHLSYSPHEIGKALAKVAEEGYLQKRGNNNRTIYEITL